MSTRHPNDAFFNPLPRDDEDEFTQAVLDQLQKELLDPQVLADLGLELIDDEDATEDTITLELTPQGQAICDKVLQQLVKELRDERST